MKPFLRSEMIDQNIPFSWRCKMLLYGDEVAPFKGVIRQKRPSAYDIYFSELHEEVVVPRYVLKSPIQEVVGVEQEIKMPLWYMRKNRLIPLTPDFRGLPNF